MQDVTQQQSPNPTLRVAELSLEDKRKLVGVFLWLVQEDKKQNPAFYVLERRRKYD